MKTLLTTILVMLLVCAANADKPEVSIYLIKKMDSKDPLPMTPEVIIQISNPTKKTFYINGSIISSPAYNTEVTRKGKWLRVPSTVCGTGRQIYPLKPGAKILVTPSFPWEEKEFRFRYYFSLDPSRLTWGDKAFGVVTRAIKREELGDMMGTIGEVDLEEIEDPPKAPKVPKNPDDPFSE